MAAQAVARATLCALRRDIARIEGRLADRLEPVPGAVHDTGIVLRRGGIAGQVPVLPTGAGRFDAALGGGMPLAGLVEIHGRETRDAGAVAGFTLALTAAASRNMTERAPLLWIAATDSFREAGTPYAPGLLQRFGILPEALFLSEIRKLEDALWVAEEAAALAGFSAIILETRGFARKLDLTATRRLHRRALTAGRPFYLLRQAGQPEPTAAPLRLVVSPAPAGERRLISGTLAGSIGPPAFTVEIAKNSFAAPAKFTLEWNQDERAFHERPRTGRQTPDIGAVASLSSDRPHPAAKARPVVAFKGAA